MRKRWWSALLPLAFAISLAPDSGADTSRAVVFVTPDASDLDASLRDAVSAQFSGLPVDLAFEHFTTPASTLREQVEGARALSHEKHAAGVFWLDVTTNTEWLVYLAEPVGNRVLMRRVPVEPDGVAAGAESVSVILRQSTEALLSGQTISMQQVAVPEENREETKTPPPPPARSPRRAPRRKAGPETRRSGASIGTMFYADSLAEKVGWQGGLRVSGSWLWNSGLYAGVGYTFFRDADISTPDLAFRLRRTPVDAGAGFVLPLGRFQPGIELRTMVDWISRRTISLISSLDRTTESTRPLVSLSPRVRLDFTVFHDLALHGAFGVDVGLNPFSYVIRGDRRELTVVELHRVRPAAELGITVHL